MKAFPVKIAAGSLKNVNMRGKFQGTIPTTTTKRDVALDNMAVVSTFDNVVGQRQVAISAKPFDTALDLVSCPEQLAQIEAEGQNSLGSTIVTYYRYCSAVIIIISVLDT